MNHEQDVVISRHDAHQSSLRQYVIGYGLSLLLTLSAYLLVTQNRATRSLIIGVITSLAFIQFVVQLVFFLHLGQETKPRWRFAVFIFMIIMVFILVAGSIWIMNNLNYHMMSPGELMKYMHENEGL